MARDLKGNQKGYLEDGAKQNGPAWRDAAPTGDHLDAGDPDSPMSGLSDGLPAGDAKDAATPGPMAPGSYPNPGRTSSFAGGKRGNVGNPLIETQGQGGYHGSQEAGDHLVPGSEQGGQVAAGEAVGGKSGVPQPEKTPRSSSSESEPRTKINPLV